MLFCKGKTLSNRRKSRVENQLLKPQNCDLQPGIILGKHCSKASALKPAPAMLLENFRMLKTKKFLLVNRKE